MNLNKIKNNVFQKINHNVFIAVLLIAISSVVSLQAKGATSGQLVADPGFELGFSGFYKDGTNDYLYRTGTGPISGAISLITTLKTTTYSVRWDYLPPANKNYAERFDVSAKVKGKVTNSSIKFNVCAVILYADSSTPITKCNPASQLVGVLKTVTSSLAVDPKRAIKKASIKLASTGNQTISYMFDDVRAELTYPQLSPTPSPTPTLTPTPSPTPSPTPTLTPTPSPKPSPSPTPTPTPTPIITPTPSPSPTPIVSPNGISGVWANEGGDKVTRDELRLAKAQPRVINRTWNGSSVQIFGAKNEVVSFSTILEAANKQASNVTVSFNALSGPNGFVIRSAPASGDGVFNWTNRDIELFYVRYLQIKGLSKLAYETYDERHIPERMRRPWSGKGYGTGLWTDRPDHDKYYPDIAVPIESVPSFNIAAGQNQSIWADIYIPKNAPAGVYSGNVQIFESGVLSRIVPVQLTVRNFTLPEVSDSKTMLHLGYKDIMYRYLGVTSVSPGSTNDTKLQQVRDRHFAMAHRHRISLVDANDGTKPVADQPSTQWIARLNGSLFTSVNGYRGPGEGIGNGVFSVGEYGSWGWQNEGQAGMWSHTNNWASWFAKNSPSTEYFLYLIDESSDTAQMETWASWMASNPGIGSTMPSFATISAPTAVSSVPSLDIITSFNTVGDTTKWQNAVNTLKANGRKFFSYNGSRPASGSFVIEDDGVALRELAWGQYKKGIQRWFYWESTYYDNFQGGTGQTDVFTKAQTFGSAPTYDSVVGMTGWNTLNGDAVLFYPGTEKVFPANNYNLSGPIASLRLKHWRRGIQDVDYITLASAINPIAVSQIVNSTIPKVLWENGVGDPSDPSWVQCDISWSNNPDVWEAARVKLANIIETGVP